MPYTNEERREAYMFLLRMIGNTHIDSVADLSFLITQLMDRFIVIKSKTWDGDIKPDWALLSDTLKALDAAREAFMEDVYRPYERKKKKQNGGVFSCTQ